MSRVIIFGGGGFLGSHLTTELSGRGFMVNSVDLAHENSVKSEKVSLHLADARCFENVSSLTRELNPHYVINCAALAGVRTDSSQSLNVFDTNVTANLNIIHAARRATQIRRLVLISSSTVYGRWPASEPMQDEWIDAIAERCPPASLYGYSKRFMEFTALPYVSTDSDNPPITILRPFSLYGPGMRPDLLFTRYALAAIHDLEFEDFDTGTIYRDFTFISDAARAVADLLVSPGPSTVVNLGSGYSVRVSDALIKLNELIGKAPRVRASARNSLDVPFTCASTEKLRRLLGYELNTPLHDGMQTFVDWVRRLHQ